MQIMNVHIVVFQDREPKIVLKNYTITPLAQNERKRAH